MTNLKGINSTNVYETVVSMSQNRPVEALVYYLRMCWPENEGIRNAFEKFLTNNRSTEVLEGICLAAGSNLGTKMNLVTTYLLSEGFLKDI